MSASLLFEPVSGKLAVAHADGRLWVNDDEVGSWRRLTNGLDRPHIYSLAARRITDRVTALRWYRAGGTLPQRGFRASPGAAPKACAMVPGTDKWTDEAVRPAHFVFHPTREQDLIALVEHGALLQTRTTVRPGPSSHGYAEADDIAYHDVHRLVISTNTYAAVLSRRRRGALPQRRWRPELGALDAAGHVRIGYPDFLFFDPRDDDTLFLGGARNDPGKWFSDPMADSIIARSTDGGRTWLELDHGMPSPMAPAFEALCLHHWDGGMMLAVGTATGEIYVSEDDGGSWTCMEDNARPVSKDHHHLAWYPKAEREAAMALRRA